MTLHTPGSAHRAVAFYRNHLHAGPADHDLATKARVAAGLAGLLGWAYAGEFDATHPPPQVARGGLYLVPSDTLQSLSSAHWLGIHGVADIFGGVVPHAFVGTKIISHPLVEMGAQAPAAWSAAFGHEVKAAVLPGFSAFSAGDARLAFARLSGQGSVRLKDPAGVGGVGQWVIGSGADLNARLAEIGDQALFRHGVVLEKNLQHVTTHSVGQVQAGGLLATYCGIQTTTHNAQGHGVYGGSSLTVARGDFNALLQLDLAVDVRTAIEQALVYHRGALAHFTGMFASRCNYDVAQGVGDDGTHHSGVLEQSWRIGGASGAEVAALQALAAHPEWRSVQARTCEQYGDGATVPAGAWLLFDGVDPRLGRIVKYATAAATD